MPPQADPTEIASLCLAGLVLLSAVFLGFRQYREAKHRPAPVLPFDQKYFANQDIRRALGTFVLLILSLAIMVGGRMPIRVDGKANLKFVQIWSGVAFLMMALLCLAMLDLVATRIYARRQRQQLADEGLSIIEAELRARNEARKQAASHLHNGHAAHHFPPQSETES